MSCPIAFVMSEVKLFAELFIFDRGKQVLRLTGARITAATHHFHSTLYISTIVTVTSSTGNSMVSFTVVSYNKPKSINNILQRVTIIYELLVN